MEMCKRCECLFFAKDLSLGHCQECKRAVLDDIARESAEVLEKLTTPPTQERERSVMEAPERIWVHDASEGTPETWDVYDNGGVEYVRADISQEFYAPQISALEQRIAELETEVEKRNHRLPLELVERIEVAIPKWQSELEIAEACSWGDMADEIQEIVGLLRKILEEVTYTGE